MKRWSRIQQYREYALRMLLIIWNVEFAYRRKVWSSLFDRKVRGEYYHLEIKSNGDKRLVQKVNWKFRDVDLDTKERSELLTVIELLLIVSCVLTDWEEL